VVVRSPGGSASHGAPYRHYPSRDHLQAEIIRRAYDCFAMHLDARPASEDPVADMRAMGVAYLAYALEHPLEYRLMFETPMPDPALHPAVMHSAHQAFNLLRQALHRRQGEDADAAAIDRDALFVWSTLHVLAGILRSDVTARLDLACALPEGAVAHVLKRIGSALQ
jgi:AcrR family transcriptional regulator